MTRFFSILSLTAMWLLTSVDTIRANHSFQHGSALIKTSFLTDPNDPNSFQWHWFHDPDPNYTPVFGDPESLRVRTLTRGGVNLDSFDGATFEASLQDLSLIHI